MSFLLLLILGCGAKVAHTDVHDYDTSLFHLGTAYNAKMVCSCLFVMRQDEERCRQLVRVSPDVARFKVDADEKLVKSRVLGGWKRSAHWVDEQTGCVVDP